MSIQERYLPGQLLTHLQGAEIAMIWMTKSWKFFRDGSTEH